MNARERYAIGTRQKTCSARSPALRELRCGIEIAPPLYSRAYEQLPRAHERH